MLNAIKIVKPFLGLFELRLNSYSKCFVLKSNFSTNRPNQEDLEDHNWEDEEEADFMNLNLTYNEHLKQLESMKENEKNLIVKQKYFKHKTPNFLTWSEKEQIRYLHSSDPELWTVEKLADGFPALPDVISKIVKSTWTKSSTTKIINHDKAVQENWRLFRKRKISNLPPELVDHLRKFKTRIINPGESFNAQKEEYVKPKGEFSEIIRSYERLKHDNSNESEKQFANEQIEEPFYKKVKKETYLLAPPNEFKEKKQMPIKFSDSEKNATVSEEVFEHKETATVNKMDHAETGIIRTTKKKMDYSFLFYPNKINIPANKRKPGCLYKLKDCYYDDDGQFLYRVPGMG